MNKRISILTLALAIPSTLWGAGSLSGLISSHGQPIPGASITITQGDNKYQALTGDDGRYQFGGIESGAFQYKVEMFGFATVQSEVKVGDGPTTLDVPLEVRAFDAPETPAVVTENKAPAGTGTTAPAGDNKKPATTATATPAPSTPGAATAAPATQTAKNQASSRRGSGPLGQRRGPAGATGNYQNLSVTESAESQLMGNLGSEPSDAGGDVASGADTAMVLNGSLSNGMGEARSDDSF